MSRKPFMFKCTVAQRYCHRTISMFTSMARVLHLKQAFEMERGETFDAVIVARHDITLLRPLVLHPEVTNAALRDIWLPQACSGSCSLVGHLNWSTSEHFDQPLQPTCVVRAAANVCKVPWAPGSSWTYAAVDWMFVASSAAADAMDRLGLEWTNRAYAEVFRRSRVSVAHHLWPFHALQSGLRLHFGLLLVDRDMILTRDWNDRYRVPCIYRSNVTLRSGQGRQFDHPAIIDRQCPIDQVAVCERHSSGACPAEMHVRSLGEDGGALSEAVYPLLDAVEDVSDPDASRHPREYKGVQPMRFEVDR